MGTPHAFSALQTPCSTPPTVAEYGWSRSARAVAWLLILFGTALRIREVAINRAFWNDEIAVALNIVARHGTEFMTPLENAQAAPVGFLWVVKAVSNAFGDHEWAMRLLPLCFGVAALPLFYFWSRRWIPPGPTLVGLLLLTVSLPAIRFTAELKPYSADLAAALLILLLALRVRPGALDVSRRAGFGPLALAGLAVTWFSFAAALVLAGAAGTAIISRLLARRWTQAIALTVIACAWLASFAIHVHGLHVVRDDPLLQDFWTSRGGFPPAGPAWGVYVWPLRAIVGLFNEPMKAGYPAIAAACCLVGAIQLARRRPSEFVMAAACLPVGLVIAMARIYPFQGRLVFYVIPVLTVATATGACSIAEWLRRLTNARVAAALGLGLILELAGDSAVRSVRYAVHPRLREEVRPVLEYIAARRRPGDLLCAFATDLALRYYGPRYGLSDMPRVVCDMIDPERSAFIATLRGQARVWFFFSHAGVTRDVDYERRYSDYLDRIGTRLGERRAPGSGAYLYNLRRVAPSTSPNQASVPTSRAHS